MAYFAQISWEVVNMFALDMADQRCSVPGGIVTVQTLPDVLSLNHFLLHQLIPVQREVGVTIVPVNSPGLLFSLLVDRHYRLQLGLAGL